MTLSVLRSEKTEEGPIHLSGSPCAGQRNPHCSLLQVLKKKKKNPQINKKQVFSRNYNPGGDGFGRMRELKFFGFREIYIIKAKFHLHPSQFSLKFLHLTSMLLHIYCESCAEEERALVLAIPLKSCKSLGRLLDLSPSFLALVSLYIKCA